MSSYQHSNRHSARSDTHQPCAILDEDADRAVADIAESTPCCLQLQLIVV